MNNKEIEKIIEEFWNNKEKINKNSDQNIINVINQTIKDLDSGKVRVAEKNWWKMDYSPIFKKSDNVKF